MPGKGGYYVFCVRGCQLLIAYAIRSVNDRAAILISCLKEEANQIRDRANQQRRSVSSYVLHTVMRSVEFEEKLAYTLLAYQAAMKLAPPRFTNLSRGPRTTVMLRCSQEESRRIRTAAARRGTTISAFIRSCLWRAWSVSDAYHRRRALERGDVR
jgi:uncharacterized protein (DUF1778 family)